MRCMDRFHKIYVIERKVTVGFVCARVVLQAT